MTEGINAPAEIWVLADDRAGNVAQCLGVAEALGVPFAVKTIAYDRLARLPNLLRGAGLTGVNAASRAALAPPWPRLVIAAGRRTAPIARWIKGQCAARLVQIMDPGFPGRGEFDLIISPAHDRPKAAPKVLEVLGAPHRVTPARLAAEADKWRPAFAPLPRPWVAVIVGGATKNRPFPVEMAQALGERVATLAAGRGGSLLLTTSRRTGAEQEAALARLLPEPRWLHLYSQGGDNPYFGFLALADAIIVTGDSVSMCCEACAADAPVFIWAPEGWAAPKHARLHAQLAAAGLARLLDGAATLEGWERPRLNAAAQVASAIRERELI